MFHLCLETALRSLGPPPSQEAAGLKLLLSDGNCWGTISTGQVFGEQRRCFSPAQVVLLNRLSNEPGIEGEREEKGALLGAHSSAQRWGIRLCRKFGEHGIDKAPHVLTSSSAGPASKGLRVQGGLMESWWDAACQPGS